MKIILSLFLLTFSSLAKAQKIDSIYIDLYTDSLKKGEYNYININGKLPNGSYLPLDTTQIIFSSNYGRFFGNSLYIDSDFSKEKVNIKAVLKSNLGIYKQFDIWIKKIPNPPKLKTLDEILKDPNPASKRKRRV